MQIYDFDGRSDLAALFMILLDNWCIHICIGRVLGYLAGQTMGCGLELGSLDSRPWLR